MEITLESIEGDLNFKGINGKDKEVLFSGNGENASPMETLLMSVAACSAIDVELILKKMRQDLKKIIVKTTGTRRNEPIPKVFTSIHLKYLLEGKLKENKVKEAVSLAVEKYCSVASSLDPNIEISFSYEIRNNY